MAEHDEIQERPGDAESSVSEPNVLGGPVDGPVEPSTLYGTVVALQDTRRVPIVPAWLRNREQRKAFAKQLAGLVGYVVALHTTRSPKYAVKMAWFAPWGLLVLLGRQIRWASHPDLSQMMHAAARKEDLNSGPHIADKVAAARKARFGLLGAELVTVSVAVLVLHFVAPLWVAVLTGAVAAPVLARVGRPDGKPILERTLDGPRFTRLHSEMVRNALVAINISGIKDPGQLEFPAPGVHRDGPGWLARVNLPAGVLAEQVMEKRSSLSSALRLPVDQIWPEQGPDHAGQLDLWVGYMPSSKMGQPTWELTRRNARTSFFELAPFATDARQRVVGTVLFETSYLLAGRPGSGKSYGARTLGTIALLDPIVEMKIAEFKGVGDFMDFAPFCSTYACGVDGEAFALGRRIIVWALAECEKRGERIRKAKERGEAPLGKITPELAARKGSGLHPVVIILDEVHELFLADPETAEMTERAIKRGRALGITFILATQIPDKSSLPPNIVRCVSIRWCMSVAGQMENDMVLGTGAYKSGLQATVYRPRIDAGWGIVKGLEKPGSLRSFFPSEEQTKAIMVRAAQLRGTTVVATDEERIQARDMLADARSVFLPNERGLHWETLAERLEQLAPEFYRGITADMVRESLARYDISSDVVNVKGDRKRGAYLAAIEAAHTRQIEAAEGAE